MTTSITSVSPSLLSTMNPQTSSTSSSTSATAGATAADSAAALQNKFMTLLVTQMKNQDPLNPMDNSQVTSQMAQLSTVTGISTTNTTLASLMTELQATQSMQASSLIGKSVVVPGNNISLHSSAGEFGVQLAGAANNLQAVIKNAAGTVVDTMNLGSLPSGVSAIGWNGAMSGGGMAPDGQYTFSLQANDGSAAIGATALAVGQVSSVSTGSTAGTQLNIPTLGQVNYSSVLQII